MNHTRSIRNSLFFIAIIVLIAVLGLYAYLYRGTGSQIDSAQGARRIVAASEATRAQSKEIQNLFKETSDLRSRITKYFVPVGDAVSFIKAIESIGAVSGSKVSISGIKANPPGADSKDHIGTVRADVGAVGSWSEVMRALELFESLPYRSEMSHMSLSTSGSRAGAEEKDAPKAPEWNLSFDITVSTL